MRSVSPDLGHIDYCYLHTANERWGIRIRPRRASLIRSDGNDLDRMLVVDGSNIELPLAAIPPEGMDMLCSVALAREEYMSSRLRKNGS